MRAFRWTALVSGRAHEFLPPVWSESFDCHRLTAAGAGACVGLYDFHGFLQHRATVRRLQYQLQSSPRSPAAFPSATWTPTIPTAVRSITASAPICASASIATTNSSRPTLGRTRSTTRPICNPRSPRRTATIPALDRSNFAVRPAASLRLQRRLPDGQTWRQRFRQQALQRLDFCSPHRVRSGRPFNILTGNDDNLQLSSLTGRPNTFVNPACTARGFPSFSSKYSPTGVFQEPCICRSQRTPPCCNSTATWAATPELRPGPSSTICAWPSAFISASASTWT